MPFGQSLMDETRDGGRVDLFNRRHHAAGPDLSAKPRILSRRLEIALAVDRTCQGVVAPVNNAGLFCSCATK